MATALSTRTEPVFQSLSINARVVRFPELTDVQNGLTRKLAPGLAYVFVDGALIVNEELRFRDAQYIARYGAQYVPETMDPDTPFLSTEEFLRGRAAKWGRFREMPIPTPGSAGALQEIAALAIEGDFGALAQLHKLEVGEWGRGDVIEACELAMEKIAEREVVREQEDAVRAEVEAKHAADLAAAQQRAQTAEAAAQKKTEPAGERPPAE